MSQIINSPKRKAILQSALDLISENGIQQTAVSMIAEKADVGVGTVYRYFTNREDLVKVLYLEIIDKFSDATFAGYSEDLSIWERYSMIWLNTLNYLIDHPKELNYMQQFKYAPYFAEEIRNYVEEKYAKLYHLYDNGVQQGIFKEMPYTVSNAIYEGILVEFAHSYSLTTGKKMSEKEKAVVIKASWDAFRK